MTARDEHYRKGYQRLSDLVVRLGAEVLARGGTLAYFYDDLTEQEKTEAEALARTFWRDRGRAWVQRSRETHGLT